MKFYPLINDLIDTVNNTTGVFKQMAEANLASLKNTMGEQINTLMYGLDVYNDTLQSLGGTTANLASQTATAASSMASSWNKVNEAISDAGGSSQPSIDTGGSGGWASYAKGTPSVPKTGLAMLHKGEAVIPAEQNTYNNSFSPSINLSVQGGGDSKSIAAEVENVLYDMGRQFKRRGFESIPGRG